MKPLVSVLIDTYNHERYIEQAIVSAVEQDLSTGDYEIIVVDDGSTDRTAEIVRKFVPRVRLLCKKNGGQASAFNIGFAKTSGEYIALLDGDDWWMKGKLKTVLSSFARNPQDAAVSHGYYEYHEGSSEVRPCCPQQEEVLHLRTPQAAQLARDNWRFLQPSALVARRRVFERVIPIPEVLTFSADSPIATASMAMGVRVLAEPLSYYRLHSQNLYSIGSSDALKLRRKYEMDDQMFTLLHPILLKLGVSSDSVSILLDEPWIRVNRLSLRTFGGSRRKALQTEIRAFRSQYGNPSFGYCVFKYLVVGAATLLMPPQRFYRLRDWYGQNDLGRFREWIGKSKVRPEAES